jgi:hypothetical protein
MGDVLPKLTKPLPPACRVDPKSFSGAASRRARFARFLCNPIVVGKQVETGFYFFQVGKIRPLRSANIAHCEAVLKITLADMRKDRFCSRRFVLHTGGIDAPGMRFEILGGAYSFANRSFWDRPGGAGLREVIDERQSRDELAVFPKVAFERRRQFTAAKK